MARRGEELLRYLYWITMNRFRKNTFDRPAQMEAAPQCVGTHTKFPCPNRYGLSLAVIGQEMVISPIDRLFSACRPARIFHAIRAVVIAAFNRKTRLICWPHIRQEVLKFVPSFADLDSTTAVVFVSSVSLISASVVHISPYRMKGGVRSISFRCCASCFRTIIGCLAIFALGVETTFVVPVVVKIRSWLCDLAMRTLLAYNRFRHGSFSLLERLCLEPVTATTAIGSLIIQTQIYGVNPQNELFFHTSSI